ncbi:MAG TPA: hypothetical protein VFK02_01095 [Kofleriaceae bacterium]|nr:hypothetical protein [Kofleriaceae bacterium]
MDHAIVEAVADEDRAVMERLAALEAEVKADADAQRAKKAAALAKLRDQRVTQTAERDVRRARSDAAPAQRKRPASDPPARTDRPARARDAEGDDADRLDLGGALELASKAHRVKQELARTPRKGEKSWIKSGVASLALGPIGWLYAGSLREAVPASVGWIALAALASKLLPVFLLMPVLMVVLPLSAIAGVVYALSYNRSGSRQRLFDRDGDKDKPKQLRE